MTIVLDYFLCFSSMRKSVIVMLISVTSLMVSFICVIYVLYNVVVPHLIHQPHIETVCTINNIVSKVSGTRLCVYVSVHYQDLFGNMQEGFLKDKSNMGIMNQVCITFSNVPNHFFNRNMNLSILLFLCFSVSAWTVFTKSWYFCTMESFFS